MDKDFSYFEIGIDCGLINYYNRYDSILKEVYQADSLFEENEEGCFAINLKAADYSFYQKNKENMNHVRCSKKIYKKVFCEKHYKLAYYLSMINHQSEKLFSLIPAVNKIFNNHLGNSLVFRNYIKKCYSPISKSRINIFILFFSLHYDILLRKERNELCYYFTKNNEGHDNAIKIREDSLSVIKEYVNLDDISNMNLNRLCEYYDILSKNYWYFRILSLDISKTYLNSLEKNKENRIIINILNLIKKINPSPYTMIKEKYPTIEELCKKVIRDNKKIKDIFGKELITFLLEKTYKKDVKEEKISTSPPTDYNLLDMIPSDFHDDIDYEAPEPRRRNTLFNLSKETKMILSNEKEMLGLVDKLYEKQKEIHNLSYERLLLLETLKEGDEKFKSIYKNAQILTSNIKSNEYYNIIDNLIKDLINEKDKDKQHPSLYLKFLLLEKSITKLYIYGDAKEFKIMIDTKIDFFNKIRKNSNCGNAQLFLHIIDFIYRFREYILSSYDLPIYFDTVYHLKYSEYSYMEKSKICQKARDKSLLIKKNVSEFLDACSEILIIHSKTTSYIDYLRDDEF